MEGVKKSPQVRGAGLIFWRIRPVNVGGLRCIHARQQYAVFSPGIIAALFFICCHIQINSILQGSIFADAPVFARNEITGKKDGGPVEIPADQFVSARIQMGL